MEKTRLLRRIRLCLAIFIAGLIVSGVTAFPLVRETGWLLAVVQHFGEQSAIFLWIQRVHAGLVDAGLRYPFLAYGTDWLAFAHLVLAVAFVGPWRDPVRNRWVVEFGLIACLAILPLALIAGPIRGIPLYWRLGDCSFGIFGAIPLLVAWRDVRLLERHLGTASGYTAYSNV